MKKNVLIIDNNAAVSDKLASLVLEVNENVDVYKVDSACDAYEILMEITIDVFLLDVVLNTLKPGDTSGMRLVENIRKIPKYVLTPVIFITAEEDPSMYAYTELNCFAYLKKPYQSQELKNIMRKALHNRTKRGEDTTLIFRKYSTIFPVKVRDLVYIESVDRVMNIHLCDGNILKIPYKSYSTLLYEADTDCLLQCSRRIVINKDYVWSIDISNRLIELRNNMGKIIFGLTYKKKLMEEFKITE